MALYARKQTSILLPLNVVAFVNQLRRRVRRRTLGGSVGLCPLGSGRRRLCTIASVRNATRWQLGAERVCRRGTGNAAACLVSAGSDTCGQQVRQMLRCVDHVSLARHRLSSVARSNRLFLKHDHASMVEGGSWHQTMQLLGAVQDALRVFGVCRAPCDDDAVFMANCEHLLLCLQAALGHVLVRKAAFPLLGGGHDRRQRKQLAWFSEFAGKRRPLSTSFPWTIKASLAVLWGVCWMFYEETSLARADRRVRQNRLLRQLDMANSVPWHVPGSSDYVNLGLELIGAQPQQATGQGRNAETWRSHGSPLALALPAHEAGGADMPGNTHGTYYTHSLPLFPVELHHPAALPPCDPPEPLAVFPQLGTGTTPWPSQLAYASLPPDGRRHRIPDPQPPAITVTGTAGSGLAQPQLHLEAFGTSIYHHQPQAPPHLNTNCNYQNQFYNMASQLAATTPPTQLPQLPIKHERTSSAASNANMPTPVSLSGLRSPMLSPTTGQQPHMPTSPLHSRNISEDRSQDGDEDGSLRKNFTYKRAEEPPKNQQGKMTCRHHECAGLFFDRKCEWSKHMDKHDRPYKCNVKGCEKLQGFTYSGGLLRHEREVHKMHGGTKKSLFCPFQDCKRSSGAGFTRKENLAEHIRRVHRRTSMSADMHNLIIRRDPTMDRSPIPESPHPSESPHTRALEYDNDDMASLKRKRASDSVISEHDSEDLRWEVKRLRQENEEKDSRLRQLEQAVMALQHQTRR